MADLKYELVATFSLIIGIIAIIGLIKNKLNMFFLSYFIIGLLIVEAEFRRYFTSMSSHNFFFGSLFLIQVVLSIPFKNDTRWYKNWDLIKRLFAISLINTAAIIGIYSYDYTGILSPVEIKSIALEHGYYTLVSLIALFFCLKNKVIHK